MDAIEAVRNLERELDEKKREAGRVIRTARTSLNLTLKDVAKKVRTSPATVHNIEQAKHWSTPLAVKIARFLTAA